MKRRSMDISTEECQPGMNKIQKLVEETAPHWGFDNKVRPAVFNVKLKLGLAWLVQQRNWMGKNDVCKTAWSAVLMMEG
jgi:hypothetical protein